MTEHRIGTNLIAIDHNRRSVLTTFPDGSCLYAEPEDNDAYRATARQFGYGDDPGSLWALCWQHEFLHTFLAVKQGLLYSPTLWTTVHPGHPDALEPDARAREEWLVLCFQRFLNTGEVDDTFRCLVDAGLDLDDLRREAMEVIGDGRFHLAG